MVRDGNIIHGVRIGVENGCGKPFGFGSEHEEHSFHGRQRPEGFGAPFAEKEQLVFSGSRDLQKGLKIIPDFQIDMLPVIEAGAFDPSTIE